jgi:hypothetical protein
LKAGHALNTRQSFPVAAPIEPIEILDSYIDTVRQFDTVQVDAVAVWVGTGYVKRLDPAGATEQVPGNTGMKTVLDQTVPALQQSEPVGRDNQVQVAGLLAN